MRNGLILFYVSFLIAGCKSKEAIPGNILPQKKMQAVLWDMMRADQFLADYVLNKDTSLNKKTESIKLYQQILDLNQVSKEKFQTSFSFYRSHPLLLKTIMDSIINTSPAPAKIPKPEFIKDSLKKVVKPKPSGDTPGGLKKSKRLQAN